MPGRVVMLARILLITLRVVQGMGAGVDMASASILTTEYAPPRRRGC